MFKPWSFTSACTISQNQRSTIILLTRCWWEAGEEVKCLSVFNFLYNYLCLSLYYATMHTVGGVFLVIPPPPPMFS